MVIVAVSVAVSYCCGTATPKLSGARLQPFYLLMTAGLAVQAALAEDMQLASPGVTQVAFLSCLVVSGVGCHLEGLHSPHPMVPSCRLAQDLRAPPAAPGTSCVWSLCSYASTCLSWVYVLLVSCLSSFDAAVSEYHRPGHF